MKWFPRFSIAMTGAVFTVIGTAVAGQAIITTDDPSQHITPTDSFSGVAIIDLQRTVGDGSCTGTLLPGGSHILTAAHCVANLEGVFDTSAATVDFSIQSTNNFKTSVTDYFVNPGWTGNPTTDGNDVAVLKLAEQAPANIQQYDIYRDNNEVGQVFTAVGFGATGTGDTGENLDDDNITKLSGLNRFDALNTTNKKILYGDFDNGNPANDLFGTYFGLNDIGLGTQEVIIAPGDSGGPGLIDGKIAGIASFRTSNCGSFNKCLTDIDTNTNSSFGELFGYTRVSNYGNFIDDAVAGRVVATAPVPEPSTNLGLIAFGASTIFAIKKKRQRGGGIVQTTEN